MLLALALAVAGCFDRFYGPKLTNAYGFDVVVTVDFDDGRSVTAQWPVCRTVFFGSKEQVITRLVVERDRTMCEANCTERTQPCCDVLLAPKRGAVTRVRRLLKCCH